MLPVIYGVIRCIFVLFLYKGSCPATDNGPINVKRLKCNSYLLTFVFLFSHNPNWDSVEGNFPFIKIYSLVQFVIYKEQK